MSLYRELSAADPDTTRALRRLTARVEWLEGRLCASGLVPYADLDSTDAQLTALAEAVLAGRDAAQRLLPVQTRSALTAVVESHAKREREQDRAARELLTVSTALESTARTDPVHAEHLARFDDAERQYELVTAELAQGAPSARSARDRLDEDDELGKQLDPVLTAGQQAESDLDDRLRAWLAAEIDRAALMPSWFSADLGPAPAGPAGRTGSAGAWLDLAVAALAYRVVYEVDDRDTVLGAPPGPDEPQHRADEHDRLAARLAGLPG